LKFIEIFYESVLPQSEKYYTLPNCTVNATKQLALEIRAANNREFTFKTCRRLFSQCPPLVQI